MMINNWLCLWFKQTTLVSTSLLSSLSLVLLLSMMHSNILLVATTTVSNWQSRRRSWWLSLLFIVCCDQQSSICLSVVVCVMGSGSAAVCKLVRESSALWHPGTNISQRHDDSCSFVMVPTSCCWHVQHVCVYVVACWWACLLSHVWINTTKKFARERRGRCKIVRHFRSFLVFCSFVLCLIWLLNLQRRRRLGVTWWLTKQPRVYLQLSLLNCRLMASDWWHLVEVSSGLWTWTSQGTMSSVNRRVKRSLVSDSNLHCLEGN